MSCNICNSISLLWTARLFAVKEEFVSKRRIGEMLAEVRRSGPLLAFMSGSGFALAQAFPVSGVSPTLIAFCLALAASFSGWIDDHRRASLASTGRLAAQLAVALLGLNVSLTEIAGLGATALPIVLISLASTLIGTIWLGRQLSVPPGLTLLIATGSAVCGASAILAAANARKLSHNDAAYAVACVTLLGMMGMLCLVPVGHALGLSPAALGVWVGAALQEVAQVLGALPPSSPEQTIATVAKLARIVMLPLVIIFIGVAARRSDEASPQSRIRWKLPPFLYWFMGLTLLRSTGLVPSAVIKISTPVVTLLLSVALAGLAIGVRPDLFTSRGWRPLILSGAAAIIVAVTSLGGVLLLHL
jgi:uncharacterized integral membrane protein (TIGR00698 family)